MIQIRRVLPLSRRPDHGVTLIEMMVVLVIVAVMAGLAITSLQPDSAQRKLTTSVELLVQHLELASNEAMVTGRPIAIDVRATGYAFLQWHGTADWQPLKDGPLSREITLSDGMLISVYTKDDATKTGDGPHVIAPDGDAQAFSVELVMAGYRRLVVFDGLRAQEAKADNAT